MNAIRKTFVRTRHNIREKNFAVLQSPCPNDLPIEFRTS
jgi:hypothetical protein